MRLKSIALNNIRSYSNEKVNFPMGKTLLSGNIGSGKTSILLGVEFALFGLQPGQRGSSILRNGEDNGGVIMEFEVGGNDVVIKRTLARGKKTISQDTCAISINGDERELSVTEIKSLILKLLNYPQELSKKQNLLYKFTVYTPQEEMKQIILEDKETRLNTLRQVFGIDKYKRILENASIVTIKLREEKRIREGVTMNLEQDEINLKTKREELKLKEEGMIELESDFYKKTAKRKALESEMEGLSKKKEEKLRLNQEIEKTKMIIQTKDQSVIDNKKMIIQTRDKINEIKTMEFSEDKLREVENTLDIFKKKKEELQNHASDISIRMQALAIKNEDNDNVKEKLKNIEVCPTCMQNVSDSYKGNVLSKIDSNNEKNVSDIKVLSLEKKTIIQRAEDLSEKITEQQNIIHELKLIKIRQGDILDKEKRLEELDINNEALSKDIELLSQHMESLESQIFDLGKFNIIIETKEGELALAMREERASEITLAQLRKEIDMFIIQIEETKTRIDKIKEAKKQLNYISKLEDWLSKKFAPLISHIEKNVMARLKQEFSKTFSEWFSMLVEDSFNVRLTDDFTPIIEQQDYEIDYSYLSGGERTAIALAYRLALNQVINSMSKINTKDLVILDEPTDGFSEQQLDKMRDVLDQLNTGQLIVVSHEQKMEDFMDNVIKFEKEGGESKRNN